MRSLSNMHVKLNTPKRCGMHKINTKLAHTHFVVIEDVESVAIDVIIVLCRWRRRVIDSRFDSYICSAKPLMNYIILYTLL